VVNGIVEQVILADDDVIKRYEGTWIVTDPKSDYAGIGWAHDGLKFVAPPPYGANWDGKEWIPDEKVTLETALLVLSIQGVDAVKIIDGAKAGLISPNQADVMLKTELIDEATKTSIVSLETMEVKQ